MLDQTFGKLSSTDDSNYSSEWPSNVSRGTLHSSRSQANLKPKYLTRLIKTYKPKMRDGSSQRGSQVRSSHKNSKRDESEVVEVRRQLRRKISQMKHTTTFMSINLDNSDYSPEKS
mmetsp:Transcript_38935/g.44522  ORF Transcript_38935/g.44522 Transcript_38935/m.44522 type:complete len:116 (+) Transcript_38935:107-454(+)